MDISLRVLKIVAGTIVDGVGLRLSIYVAGCKHKCPGCHNPQSWDFNGGEAYTIDSLVNRIEQEELDVTLTGGDPLYQPIASIELCKRVKELGRTVWLYTGFTWEEIHKDKLLKSVLDFVDVVVEGPFKSDKRDISLHFRGSTNQRIFDVKTGKQVKY